MIEPIEGAHRPIVSVMVPVYEPGPYLASTLRSVLDQDLGIERMQIAAIDDASPNRDVAAIIDEVAPRGRIELYRSPSNKGLAGSWNECIRLARGEVVHILHQDDKVMHGFYERLLPPFAARSNIGMAFCRHAFVDGSDRVTRTSHREQWRAGPLRQWLDRITERQRIQCAAAVVRRQTYEKVGGYRTDLRYALDWEMWVRIAARSGVWYEPRVLAHYRRHEDSETNRLRNDNLIDHDVVKAIEICAAHVPASERARLRSAACEAFARRSLKKLKAEARTHAQPADLEFADRLEAVKIALRGMTHSPRRLRQLRDELARLEGEVAAA